MCAHSGKPVGAAQEDPRAKQIYIEEAREVLIRQNIFIAKISDLCPISNLVDHYSIDESHGCEVGLLSWCMSNRC